MSQRLVHERALSSHVNCWYCNKNSYLTYFTTGVSNNWMCTYCDNQNILDKDGDIVDTYTAQYHEGLNPPAKPQPKIKIVSKFAFIPKKDYVIKPGYKVCDTCARNQAMIYHDLKNYIKDPSK
ncbi:Ima1, N-terminal domain-containing protein [Spinellus fusiger]|nr:Ima1, N-terminal domain-containing protein [Spinellus fusiger]